MHLHYHIIIKFSVVTHRRGHPRIRRVAAECSVPEVERVDESVNSPTVYYTTVQQGGNLNTAQMAELFLDRNSRNVVGQVALREDPVRQQRQGVSFHGPITKDRAQGHSLALETSESTSQYAINVESLIQKSARRVIQGAIDMGRRATL
ncbi:hypothetical protein ACOSQ2_014222 [Xanthoceras sorbifolium]